MSTEVEVETSEYGICKECGNKNTSHGLCKPCISLYFQQNSGNWTSGNKRVDAVIQESQLNCTTGRGFFEWIPYSKFENIEYIDKGGFGKIYSATWKEGQICNLLKTKLYRSGDQKVALKSLNDSQNIPDEFLNEFKNHLKCIENDHIIKCYGITQDPETKNYMFVMEFVEDGNLRNYLRSNFFKLGWSDKIYILSEISDGLNYLHHKANVIHKNFHAGNILSTGVTNLITDLGLSGPADKTGISKDGERKIFGVLPYIAPEILSGDNNYSKASDIYGFSMIMFEILTKIPPFHNIPHDNDLAFKICDGYRPTIPTDTKIPQLLIDSMKRCWDENPDQRPTASELFDHFNKNLVFIPTPSDVLLPQQSAVFKRLLESEIYKQITECDRLNSTNSSTLPEIQIHPSAIYTSRLLNLKNLPKPKNSNDNV
ncbi:hypothetical protein Glove_109g39 [Diversispora epigaea]|uniref:Protein kinase domain-containing protein n=1 Tax=Diversispora epigaea TaxID=1348612 RepID=A0A397J9A4_9GLOM|nr:hypothetical protein Glove_109g39 [Diversispora epigaea]